MTRLSAETASALSQRLQRSWLTRGPLSIALLPLAALYGVLTGLRRLAYRSGLLPSISLGIPLIVVGNLVAGGAGKTPTVIALTGLLRRLGYTPGIVSRGYGRDGDAVLEVGPDAAAADCGDEPLLMRRRAGVPVFVGRDRVAAGRALRSRHPTVDVIIADDGLQHLRLARTLEVLVFDERGLGNGWLLPAGPLREWLSRSATSPRLVLYNAAAATTALAGFLARRRLGGAAELTAWQRGAPSTRACLAALRGRPLLAVAGVARPDRFFQMLRDESLQFVPMALPDHHDYAALPWRPDTADVVLTEKDAVKIDPARIGHTRVWVATLDFELGADFEAALASRLATSQAP